MGIPEVGAQRLRRQKDPTKALVSGLPLVLGHRTRMQDPYVYVLGPTVWASVRTFSGPGRQLFSTLVSHAG